MLSLLSVQAQPTKCAGTGAVTGVGRLPSYLTRPAGPAVTYGSSVVTLKDRSDIVFSRASHGLPRVGWGAMLAKAGQGAARGRASATSGSISIGSCESTLKRRVTISVS